MRNFANFVAITFALVSLTGLAASQEPASRSIDESKRLIEKFHADLISVDDEISNRIESEIFKQVSIAPKDEFESTNQYSARIAKTARLRTQLEIRYGVERKNRKAAIKQRIDTILETEFTKPVKIVLQTYDADKEYFPVSVQDLDGRSYEDYLNIPRDEARIVKVTISSAKIMGLYGVAAKAGKASEYYFGFRTTIGGKAYSSVPPALKFSQKQLLPYYSVYTEPHVVYLRKAINAYLKNRDSVSDSEREAFDTIDEEYLRSKFTVFSIDPFLFGGQGKDVRVVFQDRPDAVFAIWVYSYMAVGFEVRHFEKKITDERAMRLQRIQYRQLLFDRIHSL